MPPAGQQVDPHCRSGGQQAAESGSTHCPWQQASSSAQHASLPGDPQGVPKGQQRLARLEPGTTCPQQLPSGWHCPSQQSRPQHCFPLTQVSPALIGVQAPALHRLPQPPTSQVLASFAGSGSHLGWPGTSRLHRSHGPHSQHSSGGLHSPSQHSSPSPQQLPCPQHVSVDAQQKDTPSGVKQHFPPWQQLVPPTPSQTMSRGSLPQHSTSAQVSVSLQHWPEGQRCSPGQQASGGTHEPSAGQQFSPCLQRERGMQT
jgi:hypothetical protein